MLFRSNDTATTEIYTLSLHDALPISTQKVAADSSETWFKDNPYTKYEGLVSRNHWVFDGWSIEKDNPDEIIK